MQRLVRAITLVPANIFMVARMASSAVAVWTMAAAAWQGEWKGAVEEDQWKDMVAPAWDGSGSREDEKRDPPD